MLTPLGVRTSSDILQDNDAKSPMRMMRNSRRDRNMAAREQRSEKELRFYFPRQASHGTELGTIFSSHDSIHHEQSTIVHQSTEVYSPVDGSLSIGRRMSTLFPDWPYSVFSFTVGALIPDCSLVRSSGCPPIDGSLWLAD